MLAMDKQRLPNLFMEKNKNKLENNGKFNKI